MLRVVGLWLCAATVHAIGLLRTPPEGGPVSLIAPKRFDMECESGCSFQPFCLPGPCTQQEEDEDRCITAPTSCEDEDWQSCHKEVCDRDLRAMLCADLLGKVCSKRNGEQEYDREAEDRQREAEMAMEKDEDKEVIPERICMSMSAESQDDWCTMVCNYDASSCDPKSCRCGTSEEVKGWKLEKEKSDDLEKALDFDDAPSGVHTRPKLLPLG